MPVPRQMPACLRRMLEPFTLEGIYVRLEPLDESHVPDLSLIHI